MMKLVLALGLTLVSGFAMAAPWQCADSRGASVVMDLKNGEPTAAGFTMYLVKETSFKCSQFFVAEDSSRNPMALKGYLFEVCDDMLTSSGDFSALSCWQE